MTSLKISGIALVLLLWVYARPVYAQSGPSTPQPEQGFIQSWRQEIDFPSAIRFMITLSLPPSEVRDATLVISPENRSRVTIPLDVAASTIVGGEVTEIEYAWSLPLDNPPLLFQDVNFEWQATSQSGESATIADQFTFTDQRTSWQRLDIDTSLSITLPSRAPLDTTVTPSMLQLGGVSNMAADFKLISDLLKQNLNTVPSLSLLVYEKNLQPICPEETSSATTPDTNGDEITCNVAVADKIFADSGYTPLYIDGNGLADIETRVNDYIVRKAYEPIWAGQTVPQWFQEGIILFYSPASKADIGAPLFNAARANGLLPLNAMTSLPTDPSKTELWRSESYGLVVYIASQIGVENLFKLATSAGSTGSFDEAYQAAAGKPISSLLESFRRWLFTQEAISAFAFTAYQAATPSPTPSRTPTSTRTPEPTSTLTPTLTPTVTGVLSLTPLPTRTPTRTPTPAPATNTPRAAGSLNTATPTPVITPEAASASNTNLTIGILIFIIGAAIVLVAAVLLIRPKR